MKQASFLANFSHIKVMFTADNVDGWLTTNIPLRPLEDGAMGLEFNLEGKTLNITLHGTKHPLPRKGTGAISHHENTIWGHYHLNAEQPPWFIGIKLSSTGVFMFVPVDDTNWANAEIENAFNGHIPAYLPCHTEEVLFRKKWGRPA